MSADSSVSELLHGLASFDLTAYSERTHRLGRRQLARDDALRAEIGALAAAAGAVSRDGAVELDLPARDLVEVARLFLEAQDLIMVSDTPRYEPYTTALLLRYVLGVDGPEPLTATRDRIWSAFRHILAEQIAFDMAALAGTQEPPKKDFSPGVAVARCEILDETYGLIPGDVGGMARTPYSPGTAARYLLDVAKDPPGPSAVSRLLVFPQTDCHDEVAFLRVIHMCECLFWGAFLCVRRALAAFRPGLLPTALQFIALADEFAAPLIKLFQSVREMPPEHFRGFRDATGDASAIQSQSWQLLDAHVYGVLPEKVPALTATPEVRHVLRLADPRFVPLVDRVRRLGASGVHASLRERIVELDRHLRAWRKFHERQLAGRRDPAYLPDGALGTGGTSGYGYLAAHNPPRASRVPGAGAGAGADVETGAGAGADPEAGEVVV
ncbi:hypothetical protein [Streptomyces sp. PR69]|uniref:hypothetical protein n=1 Tax=Streptomyces sp. PR69 TaxID=2984950 RepID=UPI0022655C8F|nr:hypothetical protein [Streptomyces sp. PR69]